MKNVLNRIIISFLAIIFNATALHSQPVALSPQVDLCAVVDSTPPSDEPKRIRLKSLMTYSTVGRVDGGDPFFYSPKCNNEDYFAVAEFERTKWNKKHEAFLANLKPEKNFILEVVFEGRVETAFFPTFGHLSWSRVSVQIDKIVSIVDVSGRAGLQKPDSRVEGSKNRQARYFLSFNEEVLSYFFGIRSLFNEDQNFADEFEAVDSDGRKFNSSNLNSLIGNYRPSSGIKQLQFYHPSVRSEGSHLILIGTVMFESKSGEKNTLGYETTYIWQNEFLRLARLRILK